MKKRISKIAPVIVTLFLCACGTEDKIHNENELETPLPTITQAVEATTAPTATTSKKPTPTPTEEQLAQRYINGLERVEWKELESYVNEEDSIRNSNLLNFGYLTYDNQGRIFYLNKEDGKIYASGYKGENKQLVCEDSNISGTLQLKDDWLYYSNSTGGVFRINLKTGEIEQLIEEKSIYFFIDGEKIYFEDNVKKENGFCSMELDGSNKITVLDSRGYLGNFTMGNGTWLGNMRGSYLVWLTEEKIEVIKQKRGTFPLLAGKYFSVVDEETQSRHIYNLETKREIDLKADTEKAVVSDGTDFYYWSKTNYGEIFTKEGAYCTISKWDGTSTEEIIKVEGNAFQLYHMFLKPDMLYYQPSCMIDGKQVEQLWYYDLKTGETGQIY